MKFDFIRAEKAFFPVAAMCRVLGVTRQGYYAYEKRGDGPRMTQERELQRKVRAVFDRNKERCGSPRIRRELRNEGIRVSKRRVERIMRNLGLRARGARRFRVTTRSNPRAPVAPNTLARDFTASRPNERWVTDITYVWTERGWCYLAAILDLYSRAVVGWALETTLTTELPLRALHAALERRPLCGELLHHSDRGAQYTSAAYRRALDQQAIATSMSRRGDCWDNAVAEAFFATLKKELIAGRSWKDPYELRSELFEYIEVYYNRKRLHSTLGYKTPAEVEEEFANAA